MTTPEAAANATPPLSRRDRIIPWYFVMFFAVLAVINGIMVTLAVRTHTGIVTDHAYEKGLAYNQTIAAAERQEKLGLKGDLRYEGGQLRFTLTDRSGNAITGQNATIAFTRPTQAGLDFSQPLTAEGSLYRAAPVFPAPGLWEGTVTLTLPDGTPYQHTQRVVVQ